MSVSNVNPATGETLTPAAPFSFEVTDGYTSLLVRVTVSGGVLEAAYDGGASPGYTVIITDLGATHLVSVTRDSGWEDDPMAVHVTESGVTASTWTYDIFPTQEYPEGMRPYNDSADGDATGVVTFEGRSGNVVSAAGDYDSDEVTNASGVAGATVSDALDALDAEVPPVTSVHGRTGAVVAAASDYDGSQVDNDSSVTGATVSDALDSLDGFFDSISATDINIAKVGTPDLDNVQLLIDQHIGVGIIDGGIITDNGDGTAAVSAGAGMLRELDVDTAPVYSIEWVADAAAVLTDNALNYVYVEYNAGSPQLVISLSLPTDLNTNLLIGAIHRSGIYLHPTPYRYSQNNLAFQVNRRHYNVDGTTHSSGCAISEVGVRGVRTEAGEFYLGLNLATHAAHDTSLSDVSSYYFKDGIGGWTIVPGQAQIDNLSYDDGSGILATLAASKYGVHWVYMSPHDSHMYWVYGEGSYTKAQAQAAIAPGSLPPQIDNWHGVLAGKVIIQKSSATFFSIESAFVKLFLSGGVDDHGALTGLGDDDHTQYHTDARGNALYSLLGHTHLEVDITDLDKYTQTEVDALFAALPDHGGLGGLGDDDHTQYLRADGTRALTGPLATSSTIDGRDLSIDGMKLDGIEYLATVDQTGAEIKALYEVEANAYTDTKNTKLAGIETAATADQTGAEIKTLYQVEVNAYTDTKNAKLASIENGADVTDVTNVTAAGALMRTGGNLTGNVTVDGLITVDGRDLSVDGAKLDGVEALADVTDTANVTAAGALMDSEVDVDIKTLSLPASTTISAFGKTLVDDADAAAARATLGVLTEAETDHSNLLGLTTGDDHPHYVGTWGTKNQDAAKFTSRAAHVNVPASGNTELWSQTATSYDEPMWTGDSGLDWNILRSYQPADNEIPFWTVSAGGDYCTVDDNFKYDNAIDALILGGNPSIDMAERSTAPTHEAGVGKLWAHSTQNASPMWTQDNDVDRPIVTGPTAAPGDNMMARWNGTGGHVVQNSQLYQGDNGNTTISGSIADLSIIERATGPGIAGGYARLWTKNDTPTNLMVTDDGGNKYYLGTKEIRLGGRPDMGLTQNYWYTCNTAGPHYDYIWSHPSSGSTTYSFANAFWNVSCMYFPRAVEIIDVQSTLSLVSAAGASFNVDFYMTSMPVLDAMVAAGTSATVAYWLPSTFTPALNKVFLSPSWTLNNSLIPAKSKVWIQHRRTTSTAVTADPYHDITIRYKEILT